MQPPVSKLNPRTLGKFKQQHVHVMYGFLEKTVFKQIEKYTNKIPADLKKKLRFRFFTTGIVVSQLWLYHIQGIEPVFTYQIRTLPCIFTVSLCFTRN